MSRRCQITGRGTTSGQVLPRKGLAKKKGGAGMHIGVTTKRKFKVNLHKKTVYIDGVKRRLKISTRALRTLEKSRV
jgi:large subunit ribosomal protein L28